MTVRQGERFGELVSIVATRNGAKKSDVRIWRTGTEETLAVDTVNADEVTPTKGASKRAHDERCREMFVRFFGADRKPETLSIRDWQRFITARRSGEVAPKGVKAPKKGEKPRTVHDRVIAYDLKYLLSVLAWAERAGDGRGGTLIERNPLAGFHSRPK
jgi:hypothetical protein